MGLSFDPEALDDVSKADSQRILDKCEWLWLNRHAIVHHPLKGNLDGLYKRRFAKYRILYTYQNEDDDMVIRLTGLRDDIYQIASERLSN